MRRFKSNEMELAVIEIDRIWPIWQTQFKAKVYICRGKEKAVI